MELEELIEALADLSDVPKGENILSLEIAEDGFINYWAENKVNGSQPHKYSSIIRSISHFYSPASRIGLGLAMEKSGYKFHIPRIKNVSKIGSRSHFEFGSALAS